MPQPQVSVIIPTYNRAPLLERALSSVVRQTFTDWELIVIDDGSEDGTEELIQRWQGKQNLTPKFRYLRITNGGVSRARNLGASLSRAPWLAFLDSDDEWLSDKLERQMKMCADYPLIHGGETWIRRGTRVNQMKKHAKSGGRIFSRCVDLCFVSPSTVLLRRDVFDLHHGFREDFPVCEDYELWLRLSSRYEVGFLEAPLIIKYGGHADQLSLTHRAMDLYRVRALAPFLNDPHIDDGERQHVIHTMLSKCEILLKGYAKHVNPQDEARIQTLREKALNARAQFHNTHSAAERFPRSLSTLNL